MRTTEYKGQLLNLLIILVLTLSVVSPVVVVKAAPPSAPVRQYNGPVPVVSQAITVAVSPELRSIKVEPPLTPLAPQTVPDRPLPRPQDEKPDPYSKYVDTVVQENYPAPSLLTAFRSFNGLSAADDQTYLGGVVAPPDTNGAVGPNHYVQIVNLLWAVYDKNGNLLGGPWPNNALWDAANTGDACELTNDGDPIVLYDQLANRWLLSQFALPNFPNGPFYECIAVSATGNPLGTWYLYTFQVSTTKMNDYPKLAVWPDGYYMSVNQFYSSGAWAGAGVVAFERSQMLAGNPAQMVYFDLYGTDPNLGGFLPSNLQGSTLPPSGTPNYFVLFDDDSWGYTSQDQLQIWEFHVDWTTPANSTFTHVVDLATAPFDSNMCGYSRNCIPQPYTTQKLDAISDRLMFSLQYRNFGTHESMVVNHTVDVDNTDRAGIRWYELRKSGATWNIYQQGTYSPDSADRWMGSISIDSVGNIAIGYSVSSNSIYPSVRFTGRLASDPLGQMTQGENSIVEGGGSQLNVNRWGDYSAMMVDPTDDCVFWYTQEYVSTTGPWNWTTRIGAFKMPGCGADWGDLIGTVTDSSTSAPIANARVTLSGGATTYTNASGQYTFTELPAGTYNITVTAYGYYTGSASGVVVTNGATTTRNFSLTPKPMVTVSGTVTDGSLRPGQPLSATITIPEYPGSPIYTDPSTGAYSVTLEQGVTHRFTVTSPGYLDGTATIAPMSNLTLDFALLVDSISCSAPGYVFKGFSEDFEGAFPPSGWSVVDNAGSGVVWDTNVAWGDNNYTGGSGMAATVDSDAAGIAEFDTELISPTLDPVTLPSLTLTYLANYQNLSNLDYLDLDIKVGGGGWTNLLRWNEDHGTFKGTPGETVIQDLSAYATAPFQLRWRYYDPNTNDWDWYAQVDNIRIGVCTLAPTSIVRQSPSSQVVTSGNTVTFRVTFSGPVNGVDIGDFQLTLLSVPGANATLSGVTSISSSVYDVTVDLSTLRNTANKRDGAIRLDIPASATIANSSGNPLGGLPYSGGQLYSIVEEQTFPDALPSHWAWTFIERLYYNGITSGFMDGTYRPESQVTRAQMAVFLLKAMNGPSYTPPNVSPTFSDTAGNWAEDWIEALRAAGITSGYSDGTYRPNNPVTRAEMAVFLLKAVNGPAYTPPNVSPTFSDTSGHWAEDWIEALRAAGITSGYSDGTYRPNNPVTRAEMAVFLIKAFSLP